MKIDTSVQNSVMSLKNAAIKTGAESLQNFSEALKAQASGGEERSEQYDFTKITAKQLHEKVGGLIRNGQMDLDESSSLLGFMGSSPLDKVNYDGSAPNTGTDPFNAFTRIQDAIAAVLSRNETKSAEGLQKAYDALTRFQGQESKLGA